MMNRAEGSGPTAGPGERNPDQSDFTCAQNQGGGMTEGIFANCCPGFHSSSFFVSHTDPCFRSAVARLDAEIAGLQIDGGVCHCSKQPAPCGQKICNCWSNTRLLRALIEMWEKEITSTCSLGLIKI